MTRFLIAAIVAMPFITGTAAAQEPEAAASRTAAARALPAAAVPDPNDYVIGPEDVLDISVWKNPELSRKVPVRPDGKLSLPLVNDIQAAGLTPSQLRQQLISKLTEFVPSPEINVIVSEVHSLKVAVVGAVKTPGRFELKSPATVLECIALAQGLTEFAASDRIVVLRQNGNTTTRIPFNYRKVASGSEQENFFVKPGDIIVVP
jgi:polysaccharide export outer membrane protein